LDDLNIIQVRRLCDVIIPRGKVHAFVHSITIRDKKLGDAGHSMSAAARILPWLTALKYFAAIIASTPVPVCKFLFRALVQVEAAVSHISISFQTAVQPFSIAYVSEDFQSALFAACLAHSPTLVDLRVFIDGKSWTLFPIDLGVLLHGATKLTAFHFTHRQMPVPLTRGKPFPALRELCLSALYHDLWPFSDVLPRVHHTLQQLTLDLVHPHTSSVLWAPTLLELSQLPFAQLRHLTIHLTCQGLVGPYGLGNALLTLAHAPVTHFTLALDWFADDHDDGSAAAHRTGLPPVVHEAVETMADEADVWLPHLRSARVYLFWPGARPAVELEAPELRRLRVHMARRAVCLEVNIADIANSAHLKIPD
jgi:hypothetical protein